MHAQSVSCVQLFCDPMGCSPPGSSVHGTLQARILEWIAVSFFRQEYWSGLLFPYRQEYWSGLLFPSPGDVPHPGIKPASPALADRFITTEPPTTTTTTSLQSCLSLRDPTDGSPPGSPAPGILQARTLEWVAISFSNT